MTTTARAWLYANWQYAGFVTALILLAIVAVILSRVRSDRIADASAA